MNKRQIIIISAMGVLMCVFTLMAYLNNNRIINSQDVSYVVKFDTDGGSSINSIEVIDGNHIDKPNDPKKDGYLFLSWTYNDKVYDFTGSINSDITLKAKWQKVKEDIKTYFVQFNSNGGTTIANVIVKENEKVKKPHDPVREDYLFKGWYLNNKLFDFNTNITQNTVIDARWEKIKKKDDTPKPEESKKPEPSKKPEENKPEKKVFYDVVFDTDGGNNIDKVSIEEGNKVTKPHDPKKDGCKFIGWFLGDKEFNFNNGISSNIKLVAKWEEIKENKIKVTFNSGVGKPIVVEAEKDNTIKAPILPTREGYNFNGWLLGNEEFDFNSKITENLTLTAKWTIKNYKVHIKETDSDKLILNVIEDGKNISVKSIKLSDGTLLGSGYNIEVDSDKITDSSKYIVELLGGTIINI